MTSAFASECNGGLETSRRDTNAWGKNNPCPPNSTETSVWVSASISLPLQALVQLPCGGCCVVRDGMSQLAVVAVMSFLVVSVHARCSTTPIQHGTLAMVLKTSHKTGKHPTLTHLLVKNSSLGSARALAGGAQKHKSTTNCQNVGLIFFGGRNRWGYRPTPHGAPIYHFFFLDCMFERTHLYKCLL